VTIIASKRPFFPEGIWDRRRWIAIYRDERAEVFLRRGPGDEAALLRAFRAAGLGPQPAQPERELLAASGTAAFRALARPPPSQNDASALLRAGLLDVEFGRPEQGEPLLRRAEALGSREPALGYALAKCLFRLDRTPEAVALATSWAQRDRRLDRLAARLLEVSGDR
jgi:predicted Zn-dependent protease